jgi:hypothetical protein
MTLCNFDLWSVFMCLICTEILFIGASGYFSQWLLISALYYTGSDATVRITQIYISIKPITEAARSKA